MNGVFAILYMYSKVQGKCILDAKMCNADSSLAVACIHSRVNAGPMLMQRS